MGLVVSLVACQPAAPQTLPNGAEPAVRAAIQAADEAWSTAYIAADTAAMRRLYTSDVVSMQPDAPDIIGVDAMVRDVARGFAGRTDTTVRIDTRMETLEHSGDLAWETGHVTLFMRSRESADTGAQPHRFKYITFWQRGTDGQWRIRRDLGVGDPASTH